MRGIIFIRYLDGCKKVVLINDTSYKFMIEILTSISSCSRYIMYSFFTNHRTAGEEVGHFFNSSRSLPPLHRHLDIIRVITAESSPLYIITNSKTIGRIELQTSYIQYSYLTHYGSEG